MFKSPAIRLSLALVLLTANMLFLAYLLGFLPDPTQNVIDSRKVLTESLALQFSELAHKDDHQTIQNVLGSVVAHNQEIRSAAIRTKDGKLIALSGDHLKHWAAHSGDKSTPTHVKVPIFRNKAPWATLEIRFSPVLLHHFGKSFAGLLVFVGIGCLACFYFVIRRTLRELDPSAVIPERVQKAFNTFHEGVVILDDKGFILMANVSFAGLLNRSPQDLIGRKGDELGWQNVQPGKNLDLLPWTPVLEGESDEQIFSLQLNTPAMGIRKLSVCATAIKDNRGKCRGSLVSFNDLTPLEEKNIELERLVQELETAQKELQVKNEELKFLASHDPMTKCLNRRSFEAERDKLFKKALEQHLHLCCLMLDIDHFKSVNDRFGHATGDIVIKGVAKTLRDSIEDNELAGRYGGEEFCVLLPGRSLSQSKILAENIRKEIEANEFGGIKITISLGLSAIEHKPDKPEALVDQADKALYNAKESGRNRVVCWGDIQ